MPVSLTVNGRAHSLDVDADTPLLWVIRDTLGLTGTKFGCGIAVCGACTVHVNGRAERSCMMPVSAAEGASVTTIEGLAPDGGLHVVQQAWVTHQVPQCGYCQPGMIMTAAALLKRSVSDEEIAKGMSELVCRCGTYQRMQRAIARAREAMRHA